MVRTVTYTDPQRTAEDIDRALRDYPSVSKKTPTGKVVAWAKGGRIVQKVDSLPKKTKEIEALRAALMELLGHIVPVKCIAVGKSEVIIVLDEDRIDELA